MQFLSGICHQVHDSPARIESLTAFYKHPVEIIANTALISVLMFSVLGASLAGMAWWPSRNPVRQTITVFSQSGAYVRFRCPSSCFGGC